MSESVLITGGAGSVGLRLVERFLDAGWAVRVVDLPVMDFSGLVDRPGVEVIKGDITDRTLMAEAVSAIGAVVHLAALLPPNSERDRDRTFAVNVGGTENIIRALEENSPKATLVFPSSVSTYGETAGETPPIHTGHPQRAIDVYADSKIAGEALVMQSPVTSVALRIAGIAVPAFLEPPAVWPFMPEQRVEMVHRDDVVTALFASVAVPEAADRVLNIAGGPTWQLRGRDYVADFYGFLGAPVEEAVYRDAPGWMDWYDTQESQRILKYQNSSYQHYSREMEAIVESLMAG